MADQSRHEDNHDERVQMNVRLPRNLVTTLDARRATLGLTRDEWVRRAITYALLQPSGTPQAVRSMATRSVRANTIARHPL
jgi:metal-responsive CopG/Arc/MetJ family transcriptional regulator